MANESGVVFVPLEKRTPTSSQVLNVEEEKQRSNGAVNIINIAIPKVLVVNIVK